MQGLIFGTAGIPISAQPRDTISGIKRVKELGLGAMELEFVHGVNLSAEKIPAILAEKKSQGIELTCHAPYFVNLNAEEADKRASSRHRIIQSAEVASACGARSVTFHAAYFMGQEPAKVFETVKKELKTIVAAVREKGIKIDIRPEISGKPTQFGSLEELIKVSQEVEGILPCIDFAHMHARTNGRYNTFEEISSIFADLEKGLGKEMLSNLHCHFSGIKYTAKGEFSHLVYSESDYNYKALAKALKEYNVKGVLISESPNIEEDSLLLKKTYESF